MRIAIASDHAGFAYKEKIRTLLAEAGHAVHDFGTTSDRLDKDSDEDCDKGMNVPPRSVESRKHWR